MVRFTILLVLMQYAFSSSSQTNISGTIHTGNGLSNIERNFTGFNSGQGYLENIYNIYAVNSGLEVNPAFHDVFNSLSKNTTWRFPGGTSSNFYNRWASGFGYSGYGKTFGDSWLNKNLNTAIVNANYGDYDNYYNAAYPNAQSNVIFPFINSVTKNKTVSAKAVFCINIINHYRNISLIAYDTRKETLLDSTKIKGIVDLDEHHLDAFNSSSLSDDFKKTVRQNLDAFFTLIRNGVTVNNIEIGNEIYSYAFNDNAFSDYTMFLNNNNIFNPADTKVWIKDDGSAQSLKDSYSTLWTYARLAKLYRVLLTDSLQKLAATEVSNGSTLYKDCLNNIKFGIPIAAFMDGGLKRWNNFMIQPEIKEYTGADAYIVHPYFDQANFLKGMNISAYTNSNTAVLANEFNAIRDTLELSYNKRFFKGSQVNLINALPEGSEVWYTEWNFNFDNNNLKKAGNTLLHAMYYYDAMINFIDINANRNLSVDCRKSNPIKLCNYHMPYAKNDTWYNMTNFKSGYLSTPSDPSDDYSSDATKIDYNSTYYTALLLSPVLEDTSLQYSDAVNGGFEKSPNISFRSFHKKTDATSSDYSEEIYVYFNNKSAEDYRIDLEAALGLKDTKSASVSAHYIHANNLYASMGATTFRADDFLYTDTSNGAADITIQRVFNLKIQDSSFNAVTIPKYSLGYLKVNISVPVKKSTDAATLRGKAYPAQIQENEKISVPSDIRADLQKTISEIKIYPNPNTTGNLHLDISSLFDTTTEIQVYDITGTLLKHVNQELTEGHNALQLDLSDLARASYILHISGGGLNHVSKVLLQ